MNNIDLEKFIIGLSKIQLQCTRGDVKLKDVVNMALDSQNLQVDDDFELTILRDKQKFEEGDWIVRKDGKPFGQSGSHTSQIIKATMNEKNDKYMYWISEDEYICDYVNDFRKWTLEDARDGDVLKEDSCTFIYRNMKFERTATTYCVLFGDGEFVVGSTLSFDVNSTYPATKEQRDILFQKMKEVGYKWDAEKKELINEIDEPFDDLELTLYDWLSSDTCGEISQRQMRRTVKARAKEIREKLR